MHILQKQIKHFSSPVYLSNEADDDPSLTQHLELRDGFRHWRYRLTLATVAGGGVPKHPDALRKASIDMDTLIPHLVYIYVGNGTFHAGRHSKGLRDDYACNLVAFLSPLAKAYGFHLYLCNLTQREVCKSLKVLQPKKGMSCNGDEDVEYSAPILESRRRHSKRLSVNFEREPDESDGENGPAVEEHLDWEFYKLDWTKAHSSRIHRSMFDAQAIQEMKKFMDGDEKEVSYNPVDDSVGSMDLIVAYADISPGILWNHPFDAQ